MKPTLRAVAVVAVALAAARCGTVNDPDSPEPPELIEELPRELSVAETRLIEADNRFALELFREISRQEGDENIFISPLSVGMALGMTYNGAGTTTQEAMQETLELEGLSLDDVNRSYRSLIDLLRALDPGVEFLLANSIWYRLGLPVEQAFLDVNREFFDAEVQGLNFAAPDASETINDWVDDKTSGKIPEIVPDPIPGEVVMYLINAIFFKGSWTFQFDEELTRDEPFTLIDGTETPVTTMVHAEKVDVDVGSALTDGGAGMLIVDLPYGGKAFSMTIIRPDSPDALNPVIDNLTADNWQAWVRELRESAQQVSLPKFTLEYELLMNDVLTALGMGIAFDQNNADFYKIADVRPERLYISRVTHKTFVDVNEEGTEAAAATSVEIGITSATPILAIDRPFVFVIREKLSGTILFMGKIVDPR